VKIVIVTTVLWVGVFSSSGYTMAVLAAIMTSLRLEYLTTRGAATGQDCLMQVLR